MNAMAENEERFLIELFEKTDGKTAGSISMYDIGSNLGLEKEGARQIAENLMSEGLVEVRSLSGSIALTQEGIEAAENLGAGGAEAGDAAAPLTTAPIIDEAGRETVEALTASLKARAGELELSFDPLAELVADLRTIDAQLASSRPKTAVIRACFESIRKVLQTAGDEEELTKVKQLLGEKR